MGAATRRGGDDRDERDRPMSAADREPEARSLDRSAFPARRQGPEADGPGAGRRPGLRPADHDGRGRHPARRRAFGLAATGVVAHRCGSAPESHRRRAAPAPGRRAGRGTAGTVGQSGEASAASRAAVGVGLPTQFGPHPPQPRPVGRVPMLHQQRSPRVGLQVPFPLQPRRRPSASLDRSGTPTQPSSSTTYTTGTASTPRSACTVHRTPWSVRRCTRAWVAVSLIAVSRWAWTAGLVA